MASNRGDVALRLTYWPRASPTRSSSSASSDPPATFTSTAATSAAVGDPDSPPVLLAHRLILPRNQRAHTWITEEQTAPHEDSYVHWRENVTEQWIPDACIGRHSAA